MIKHIYDEFAKRWYRPGGTIYFYSDPHFADDEMKYLRKNYIGDDEQVKCINSVVGKNDTLIILGDVGDINFVKKLHGYKVLIMGNHDYTEEKFHEVFDEVYKGPLFISDKILLSHEPMPYMPYVFNIHGHDHSNWFASDRSMNLCAEHINYTPVRLKQIVESGALKFDNIHRHTIDNAIERKRNA